jgi:hypothetical protein
LPGLLPASGPVLEQRLPVIFSNFRFYGFHYLVFICDVGALVFVSPPIQADCRYKRQIFLATVSAIPAVMVGAHHFSPL